MADDLDLDELRAELDDFAQPQKAGARPAREERIIAGFEDIQRFVSQHGRVPRQGDGNDIFERIYAVRLDRLRALDECRTLLAPLDHQRLLGTETPPDPTTPPDDDELLAELRGASRGTDIVSLRHVRASAEKRAALEIETREPCVDFEQFAPLFEAVQRDVKTGARQIHPFASRTTEEITVGAFFVVGGQTAYVAHVGDEFTTDYERRDSRLRVIYDNGTESKILRRSLQRALHRDAAARYVTNPDSGPLLRRYTSTARDGGRPTEGGAAAEPLFAGSVEPEDLASGTIYVLRSKSLLPEIAAHREVVHKIGVTGGRIADRIANAAVDPTFLMADVEVVATYQLYNINRVTLENVIHRVLEPGRLVVELIDRFGTPVRPREWFLVPLFVIDEVVQRIKDKTITEYVYEPKVAKLVESKTF